MKDIHYDYQELPLGDLTVTSYSRPDHSDSTGSNMSWKAPRPRCTSVMLVELSPPGNSASSPEKKMGRKPLLIMLLNGGSAEQVVSECSLPCT